MLGTQSDWYSTVCDKNNFLLILPSTSVWLDGKKTKTILQETARETTALMQLTANDISELKSSCLVTLTPLLSPISLQGVSGVRNSEGGSRLQILQQIKLFCAVLSTKEPLSGSSEVVYSRSGNPPVRYCGFMGSVCHLTVLRSTSSSNVTRL